MTDKIPSTSRSDADLPETADVNYTEAEKYNLFHVSGARGGFQPKGELKLDLFTEYYDDPQGERYNLQDGTLGGVSRNVSVSVTREKQATGLMSDVTAYRIGIWLLAMVLGVSQQEMDHVIAENFREREDSLTND